ncbi:MAG TPA: PAS domain S-box protein [Candidatus Acidoferrales bacterium]|nr:PAS domain S-box protein [Candidatus Acidoferrales bacterium]
MEPLRIRDAADETPEFVSGPESAVLDLINIGAPLEEVLAQLCRSVEARIPGMLSAVLLTDQSGARLRLGAAPNLPAGCHEVLDGCGIGADSMPCGVAGHRRELVVVADLMTDPVWGRYRETALEHGMRACWAAPIISAKGVLLGVFAAFFREAHEPVSGELHAAESASQLARIAIERQIHEKALREAEEQYRTMIEQAIPAIFRTTPEGAYVSVNPACARLCGYETPEEMIRSIGDISTQMYVDPARRVEFQRLMEEQREVRGFEYEIRKKDGTRAWISESSRAVQSPDGSIAFYEGSAEDITERRRAETERRAITEIIAGVSSTSNLDELLALIHQSLRRVLYAENCFIALHNRETGLFHFPFFADEFDQPPPPQKLGRTCTEYVFRTGRPMSISQKEFDQLAAQGEVELVGTPSPSWLGAPLRTPTETIGVLVVQHYSDEHAYSERDTEFAASVGGQIALAIERKQAEDALRKSERHFRALIENSADILTLLDPAGVITYCSPSVARILGYDPEEMIGHSAFDWVRPEHVERVAEHLAEALRNPGRPEHVRAETHARDGTWRMFDGTLTNFLGVPGVEAVVVNVRDITEQERAQEALNAAEGKFRTLVEQLPAITYVAQPGSSGEWEYVSPQIETLLGFTQQEWIGLASTWWNRVHPDDRERVAEGEREFERTGTPMRQEYRMIARDGRVVWFRDEAVLLHRTSGRPQVMQGVLYDITDQRRLEDQLRQAQKMEAVGRLAGGVAHDFNNLLMVIQGHTSLLSERLPDSTAERRSLEQIQKSTERAASLTRQLLAFSRLQVMQPRVLDLNSVVADMGKMLRRLIGEHIELILRADSGLGRVKADPGQIEQVLLNLVVNARDAMAGGGKLVVETCNLALDEAAARRIPSLQPGSYVVLSVSDTGVGMDPETQSHIFEPFFTTKEQGKGTGLGLATVYGIVQQSGGQITVYSQPGQGATFRLYFPRVEEPADRGSGIRPRPKVPKGSETILLAEDETEVRELAREALRRGGYAVLEARDGEEARRLAENYAGPIHLLVTDVVMPNLGGPELASRLLESRPGLKVLYMSGYSEFISTGHVGLGPLTYFLQKPFSLELLGRKVREVLDEVPVSAGSPRVVTP